MCQPRHIWQCSSDKQLNYSLLPNPYSLTMYNNKKIKFVWTIIAFVAVVAMIFFTLLPAFQSF